MRDAERDLAFPARGLELDVARAHRGGELGRLRERCSHGAREPFGTRGQGASGRHGQHDGDSVAGLGVEHCDAARPRVLQQAPPVVAQRSEHDLAPLRRAKPRELGGVHRSG